MNLQILRLPEVVETTGLPVSSIYKSIARGTFPRPIKLGVRSSGWIKSEIDSWLEERIEFSRNDGGVSCEK